MKLTLLSIDNIHQNDLYLHAPSAAAELQSTLIWAIENKPSENFLNGIKDDRELDSLLLKVEIGRESMRKGFGRSNEDIEALFAARRADQS